MSFLDDDHPKKQPAHELGSDLTMLSTDELDERILLLKQEIARLEAEKERKAAGKRAADSFFKS
jgi:uncharacterized small protein (DUF1192 family)